MMRMGLGMVAVARAAAAAAGRPARPQHPRSTSRSKIAAMEGHWEDEGPADLVLFARAGPEGGEESRSRSPCRSSASLILTHSTDRPRARAEGLSAGRAAAGRERVLRVSHHGGHRAAAHRARRWPARCCGGASGCSIRSGICDSRATPGRSVSSRSSRVG